MSKGRVFLIHWNKEEAEGYADNLHEQGWDVHIEYEDGGRAAKAIKEDSPSVVITYLTLKPSHGLATAEYLAQTKSTQNIPLVFVGGEAEAVAKTKIKLPNAKYVSDHQLVETLEQCTRQ